ncbi:MAG: 16S rRNA (cytosine(967)-C(5))-methyltransferase RsmB [Selenomonadaceae bacterium]|nr:16S rRNA (cytosine(967)-C(5))-methyltransferase RsmB [Selenomonadaceae bacterium]
MDKARAAAIQVVFEVNERDAYSNIALANILRNKKLSDIDRRFCTELVYGTVKAGQSIDWIIEKYVTRSLKQIDPKILAILRVGMYQIFFLDRVPNSAVVNESVEIAKKISVGASKFVNAVLRSAVREPNKAKFPSNDSAESIALSMYHPLWLVKRWIEQFGINETKNICAADNEQPPLTLRVNLLKTTKDEVLKVLEERGVKAESSKHAAEAVVCRNLGALDDFDLLKKGFCQVQDESSMIATHMLAPQPGEFIIDCCAAPGGKATHIAEMMNNTGRVVAIDIYDHKIKQIKDNATRLGIKIIEPLLLDATTVGDKFNGVADRVLVDAPCSGLGVLRRKADLRWKKKPDELAALPKLQLKILKSAAKSVKVGGVLLYSTCTLEKAENIFVVNKFLQSNKQFELESDKMLLPHVDHTDGFFIAKMKRIS